MRTTQRTPFAACRAGLAALVLITALTACGEGQGERTAAREGKPFATRAVDPRAEAVRPAVAPAASVPKPESTPQRASPDREVTYEEAEAAFRDRRYDQAVGLFAAWTERRSDSPWGHYMLGLSAWKAGLPERAVSALERALELDPDHVRSLINVSRVLLELERPEKALPRIERALELDAESAEVWRVAGNVHADLGRSAEAETAYHRSILLDEGDAWALNNLGLLLIREGRFDEALGPLARATELSPGLGVAHNNLGVALERTGHISAAARAYRSGAASEPPSQRATASLARLQAAGVDPEAEGTVEVAELARTFELEVEEWRRTVVGTGSAPREVALPAESASARPSLPGSAARGGGE